jgi:ABC-type cobalt transport system substrate-binding protein
MTPATEGKLAGNSVMLVGMAVKDDQRINFNIGIDESYSNTCGDFVGDERKGILQPGDSAEIEMTFHFDHIFGDADLPAGDSLNEMAPGFEPFASVAEDGSLDVSLSELGQLLPEDDYQKLVDILPTLGHTGEGHCSYDPVGTLEFAANGEDFIRQGFTSKDGWNISFDNVWINLADITAYQTNPPYDPDEMEADIKAEQVVQLPGNFVVDLAAGDENAAPIPVDDIIAPAGRYNALGWKMEPATSGPMEGYSLIMAGTAEKEGESLPFTISVEESYRNLCGEYIGDTRKGILTSHAVADLEMTFHFDHIFGDGDLPAGDSLNELAPGFEPFASVVEDGVINANLATLQRSLPDETFQQLLNILPTLGHTGEGHCFYGP